MDMQELRARARERMKGYCRVCPVCDGRACAGETPGMGGIGSAEDAIEFLLAGATAVSVGAMNFVNPYTCTEVVEGIERYMEQYHVEDVTDLIGAVRG